MAKPRWSNRCATVPTCVKGGLEGSGFQTQNAGPLVVRTDPLQIGMGITNIRHFAGFSVLDHAGSAPPYGN
jgi:hypothetical protein